MIVITILMKVRIFFDGNIRDRIKYNDNNSGRLCYQYTWVY